MHNKLNNILTSIVIGFGCYLLLAPLTPAFDYWVQKRSGFDLPAYVTQVASDQQPPVPTDNRLAIPSIGLDEHVFEGTSPDAVHQGVLRQPKSSKPTLGSNTVMVGHRFSYFPEINAPFFNLDKIAIGDDMVVAWEGIVYRYKVTEVKIVAPTEVSVEEATNDARLTIYTCTPLWTAEKRLVIIGDLVTGDAQ